MNSIDSKSNFHFMFSQGLYSSFSVKNSPPCVFKPFLMANFARGITARPWVIICNEVNLFSLHHFCPKWPWTIPSIYPNTGIWECTPDIGNHLTSKSRPSIIWIMHYHIENLNTAIRYEYPTISCWHSPVVNPAIFIPRMFPETWNSIYWNYSRTGFFLFSFFFNFYFHFCFHIITFELARVLGFEPRLTVPQTDLISTTIYPEKLSKQRGCPDSNRGQEVRNHLCYPLYHTPICLDFVLYEREYLLWMKAYSRLKHKSPRGGFCITGRLVHAHKIELDCDVDPT